MFLKNYIPPVWYAIIDFCTAALAWASFYFLRKIILHQPLLQNGELQVNNKFWLGIFFIPIGWLMLYLLAGSYNSLYKKSRLKELTNTFICSIIGCLVLFFAVLLDDTKNNYSYYYTAFSLLFALHFLATFSGRSTLLSFVKEQLLKEVITFPAIIVGPQKNAERIYKEVGQKLKNEGYHVKGFIAAGQEATTDKS